MEWTGLLLAVSALAGAAPRIVSDTAKAQVVLVQVSQRLPYSLLGGEPGGAVWVALEDDVLVTEKRAGTVRRVTAGVAKAVAPGEQVEFSGPGQRTCQIVVIKPRSAIQPLTVRTTILDAWQELQDASSANDTLVVAISPLRLRDVWNLGDESEWKPSKPRLLALPAGAVVWIPSGMHHITNLLPRPAKLVTVEW
jgi:hypothetical protein